MMFVYACFVGDLKNDPGFQKMNWYSIYMVMDKSLFRVIRYSIHCSRGPEEC